MTTPPSPLPPSPDQPDPQASDSSASDSSVPVPPSPVIQAYTAQVHDVEPIHSGQRGRFGQHGRQAAGRVGTSERRRLLPLMLFLSTCLSTFWVGGALFHPLEAWGAVGTDRFSNLFDWQSGLTYMVAVLSILLAHEMGHFLFTLRYKIPASYPLFIPIPFNPIGTMGAVIGMDGLKANRRQLFDLALAGPVAGLVVAIPILCMGIAQLDLTSVPGQGIQFTNPILIQWLYGYLHPGLPEAMSVSINQLNPLFMAGWVGLLITGLNMLPISQLDGGHVTYALFGKRARMIARGFLVLAILFVINNESIWTLMLILVILMGVDHPPTSDDSAELNELRWRVGVLSLAIPILCFPIHGILM